jgi:hypothetical protein
VQLAKAQAKLAVTVEWTTRKLVDIVEHEIAGREHGRSIPRIFAEHIAAPPTSFARHPFLFLLAELKPRRLGRRNEAARVHHAARRRGRWRRSRYV